MLIQQHSSANRVVETDLLVRYSKTRIYGSWSWVLPGGSGTYSQAWQYVRTAVKSYKYVGMTRTAANTCAAAMLTKYTRQTVISVWNPSVSISEFQTESGGDVLMADVAIQHEQGNMWCVIVNVNETDSRILLASASPASLFTAENQRDYDTAESTEGD